jgi:hypothetical protein
MGIVMHTALPRYLVIANLSRIKPSQRWTQDPSGTGPRAMVIAPSWQVAIGDGPGAPLPLPHS